MTTKFDIEALASTTYKDLMNGLISDGKSVNETSVYVFPVDSSFTTYNKLELNVQVGSEELPTITIDSYSDVDAEPDAGVVIAFDKDVPYVTSSYGDLSVVESFGFDESYDVVVSSLSQDNYIDESIDLGDSLNELSESDEIGVQH